MGSTERRERERSEKREMILQAAMRLFLEESFERTTMRRIADAIEHTPGALYGYFKDKDEILYALHERGFDELTLRMQEALAGREDPSERLAELGRAYIRFALDNPQQYHLMFIAKSTARKIQADAEWECGLRSYGLLREEVGRFLAHKRSPIDPEVATYSCWAMCHGIVSLVIAERSVFIPDEVLPRLVSASYELFFQMMNGLASFSGATATF